MTFSFLPSPYLTKGRRQIIECVIFNTVCWGEGPGLYHVEYKVTPYVVPTRAIMIMYQSESV